MISSAHQRSKTDRDSQSTSPLLTAQSSPLGDQLYFVLGQLQHTLQTRMHYALAAEDLNIRQYTTLAFLADGHRPVQHDLSALLHLDPSQVVKLVKGMEADGLVIRQTNTTDRRAKVLAITAQGQQRYSRAVAAVQQVHESLTASLSRRDRNALKSLLHRVLPVS